MTEDIYFKQIGRKEKKITGSALSEMTAPLWTETWIKNPVFRFITQVKEERISFLIFIKYPKMN